MSVCVLCGLDLIRVGIADELRCPIHGTRGLPAEPPPVSPSKPVLRDPQYDF